jgi:hypothetical protein
VYCKTINKFIIEFVVIKSALIIEPVEISLNKLLLILKSFQMLKNYRNVNNELSRQNLSDLNVKYAYRSKC